MSILGKAVAHFESLKNGEINVPEWDVDIFWKPLSLHAESKIYAADDAGVTPSAEILWTRALIQCALDKDGAPAFDEMKEDQLRHAVDSRILKRVAQAILGGSTLSGDVAGKVKTAKKG